MCIRDSIPIEEEIKSVFHSSEYAGVIVGAASGEYNYRMDVYKANGDKLFSEPFSYDYQNVDVDGEHIFLYNEDSCRVYNMWGNLKFEGEFDFTVSKITNGSFPNSLIAVSYTHLDVYKRQVRRWIMPSLRRRRSATA